MFKFADLNGYVPVGQVITSAKVILTPFLPFNTLGSAMLPTTAYQITTNWSDANTTPTPTIGTSPVATATGYQESGLYTFDITALAHAPDLWTERLHPEDRERVLAAIRVKPSCIDRNDRRAGVHERQPPAARSSSTFKRGRGGRCRD